MRASVGDERRDDLVSRGADLQDPVESVTKYGSKWRCNRLTSAADTQVPAQFCGLNHLSLERLLVADPAHRHTFSKRVVGVRSI
jgi:hypothetical protein